MASHYLNTDFCVLSVEPIDELVGELAATCDIGYHTRHESGHSLTLNAKGAGIHGNGRSPSDDIRLILDALDELSPVALAQLAAADQPTLNVGWQAAETRPEGAFDLPPELLAEMARKGIALEVTIYPSCENEM